MTNRIPQPRRYFGPYTDILRKAVDFLPYDEIDPKIRNLVCSIWYNGLGTSVSCEGHMDHGSSYPWVVIFEPWRFDPKISNNGEIDRFLSLIERYNPVKTTGWMVDNREPHYHLMPASALSGPKTPDELAKMQDSAEELAQYLFDNRIYNPDEVLPF